MRIRGSRLQQEKLDAADAEWVEGRGPGLSRVYDALNSLGSTPWAINHDVFRVVETGEGFMGVWRREARGKDEGGDLDAVELLCVSCF